MCDSFVNWIFMRACVYKLAEESSQNAGCAIYHLILAYWIKCTVVVGLKITVNHSATSY